MKRLRQNIFATFMMLCSMTTFISCSDISDNPVIDPNPLASIIGSKTWWADYKLDGEYVWSKDDIDPYSRIIETYSFSTDGSGVWNRFYLKDDESEPFALSGGKSYCGFHYTSTADGLITITIDEKVAKSEPFPQSWTVRYEDEAICFTDTKGQQHQSREASDDELMLTQDWIFNIDGGAAMVYDNINDGEFTYKNWRKNEAIYLYDGKGDDKRDKQKRLGYTLVPLPWYGGDKQTNLPEDFCNSLTSNNGWELVLNRCGARPIKNNNFIAFYNKYTGILRFFYYMPEGFSAGNDHAWQVSMTDGVAHMSQFGYMVPKNRTIKDKLAIDQNGKGFYQYVTPWVDYLSADHLIVPNAGWWAFDVDMSNIHKVANLGDETIRLQMRSWKTQHVTLTSSIMANLNGKIKAKINLKDYSKTISTSTAGGVLSTMNNISDVLKIVDVGSSLVKGNFRDAFNNCTSFLGGVCSLIGIPMDDNKETGQKGGMKGTISLKMEGNIDTEGIISGSEPTVGPASPTFQLKDFDLKHSHLGQGVWALKKAPVVYMTNAAMIDKDDSDGWRTEYWKNGFYPYFLDPTSIEVELNPNIFPQDQIEWIQVDAIPGVRTINKFDGLARWRKAQGFKEVKLNDIGPLDAKYVNQNYEDTYSSNGVWREGLSNVFHKYTESNALTDFYYAMTDKKGLDFLGGIYSDNIGQMFGRGVEYESFISHITEQNEQVILAPTFKMKNLAGYSLPSSLEINVFVAVKLKNMKSPLCYNRQYLPDVKQIDSRWDLNTFWRDLKKYKVNSKQKGHTETYDYQLKRIHDIFEMIMPDFETIEPATKRTFKVLKSSCSGAEKLFDHLTEAFQYEGEDSYSHSWIQWHDDMSNNEYVEFMCNEGAFKPTKYTFWQANDNYDDYLSHPDNWKLYGKKSKNDKWKLLDDHGNDNVDAYDYKYRTHTIKNPAQCQYFRLEIKDPAVGIGEFTFNN